MKHDPESVHFARCRVVTNTFRTMCYLCKKGFYLIFTRFSLSSGGQVSENLIHWYPFSNSLIKKGIVKARALYNTFSQNGCQFKMHFLATLVTKLYVATILYRDYLVNYSVYYSIYLINTFRTCIWVDSNISHCHI